MVVSLPSIGSRYIVVALDYGSFPCVVSIARAIIGEKGRRQEAGGRRKEEDTSGRAVATLQ